MPRLPGDPSVGRWLLFAVGFRLPAENREWVRHELTDAGWRGRTIRRLLVLMVPICIGLAFLPGPDWLRIAVPGFALIASEPREFTIINIVGSISIDDLPKLQSHLHLPKVADSQINLLM